MKMFNFKNKITIGILFSISIYTLVYFIYILDSKTYYIPKETSSRNEEPTDQVYESSTHIAQETQLNNLLNNKNMSSEVSEGLHVTDQSIELDFIEKASQFIHADHDLVMEEPTQGNTNIESTGEHSDQINQQLLNQNAQDEGYLPQKNTENSQHPNGSNANIDSTGDYATEINQDLIDITARQAGYLLQDIASNTNLPNDKNILNTLEDEKVQEINQEMINKKAKSDGYLP